jgi:hypothetical protein
VARNRAVPARADDRANRCAPEKKAVADARKSGATARPNAKKTSVRPSKSGPTSVAKPNSKRRLSSANRLSRHGAARPAERLVARAVVAKPDVAVTPARFA